MTRVNGIEVIKILKSNKDFQDIPAVVISARVMSDKLAEATNAGCIDFIKNPFNIKEIIQTTQKYV